MWVVKDIPVCSERSGIYSHNSYIISLIGKVFFFLNKISKIQNPLIGVLADVKEQFYWQMLKNNFHTIDVI